MPRNNFKYIWSLAYAWGTFEIINGVARLNIAEGEISLKSFGIKFCDKVSSVKIDEKHTYLEFEKGKLRFEATDISCLEIVL